MIENGCGLRRLGPLAVAVEREVLQEHQIAVAGEDVGGGAFHVELGFGHELLAGVRVEVIERGLRQLLAGRRVEPVQHDAAVQIRRPAGGRVERVVLHQHGAVDRPERFELAVGADQPFRRRGAEPPHQRAVGRADAINPAVGGAEEDRPWLNRRRAVDPPAGGELPEFPAVRGGQRVDGVRIGRGHEHLPVGDDRLRQPAAERRRPLLFHRVGNRAGDGAAAARSWRYMGQSSADRRVRTADERDRRPGLFRARAARGTACGRSCRVAARRQRSRRPWTVRKQAQALGGA